MKYDWIWYWFVFPFWGCQPQFEERASIITAPRILAVRAEPPESDLGQAVAYEALIVTPDASFEGDSVRWSFCAAPKPLTENNSVSAACLGDAVRPIDGAGLTVIAKTPADACQLFGPDTPPGDFRPRDPDNTGGFYQPIRVEALGQTAFAFERMACNLPNAPLDVAVDLAKRYVRNQNPMLLPIRINVNGENGSIDALPAGREIQFDIGWNAEDAENFVALDPPTQSLVPRREAMRTFWYATAGVFEHDVIGRGEQDQASTVSNLWRAPDEPQRAFLWVVVRDSRGGMDFAAYTVMTK